MGISLEKAIEASVNGYIDGSYAEDLNKCSDEEREMYVTRFSKSWKAFTAKRGYRMCQSVSVKKVCVTAMRFFTIL